MPVSPPGARDEMACQNALGRFYARHGSGLLNDDPTALNALAATSPEQVVDL